MVNPWMAALQALSQIVPTSASTAEGTEPAANGTASTATGETCICGHKQANHANGEGQCRSTKCGPCSYFQDVDEGIITTLKAIPGPAAGYHFDAKRHEIPTLSDGRKI